MTMDLNEQIRLLQEKTNARREEQKLKIAAMQEQRAKAAKAKCEPQPWQEVSKAHLTNEEEDRVFIENIDLQEYKEEAMTDKDKRLAEQKRLEQEYKQAEELKKLEAELERNIYAFKKAVELDVLKRVKELGSSSVKDLNQDELDKIAKDTLARMEKTEKKALN